MKNFLFSGLILGLLVLFFGSERSGDIYEQLGSILGTITIPLFNGYLVVKYLDHPLNKKYKLFTFVAVGLISLLINSTLILLIIVGALLVDKAKQRGKKQ